MIVELRPEPFDPYEELRRYQGEAASLAGRFGATAVFVGTMRELNEGEEVREMTLEHYPEMTERHLAALSREAAGRWDLLDTLILHRVGGVRPNDAIVLVAVWAAHRGAALDACSFLIEDLKSKAPFWKKEELAQGSRWVEKNTPR